MNPWFLFSIGIGIANVILGHITVGAIFILVGLLGVYTIKDDQKKKKGKKK